jgi:hypothetical protein
MRAKIKLIFRGCTDLKHCGNHPGNSIFILGTVVAAVIGAHSSPVASLGLGLAAFLIMTPFYAYGAYKRAIADEEIEEWLKKSKLN